ncbi:ROK family transcriptional regulator [Cryobacterium ruanii]|uniref:ROK family transcriptional regulator n=1 Tax=Cryobacterium ruanii TaxID=1259197 RepID=A0A4R9AKN4_9MICO|nr:ROK family transcriptional regulator [Cryobacterium ruanii]TFD63552.1 ROK family transcriptional regulator [Cryobacterium ruanii]
MTSTASPPGELGSSNERLRRHNLSAILRLVHRSQGLPRATITRQTGLNRSTVAALVAELVASRLVVESEPDPSRQVGRPSGMVMPALGPVALTVNPEIDAITVAAVALGGQVLRRRRLPLDCVPSADEAVRIAVDLFEQLISDLGDNHDVVGIGVAMPGLVRQDDGLVLLAPHLGWTDAPFARMLSGASGYPVRVANDASLGGMAECIFGAGRDLADVIYLNGGASGIGGGIVSGRLPVSGADGYAGEFGHTIVNSAGARCHCGASGCLETEVRRDRLLSLLGLPSVDDVELAHALEASTSEAVQREVARQLGFLAIALRNAINTLNPARIILGGFLACLYAISPEALDASLASQPLRGPRETATIRGAELGQDILIIGAAEIVFESLLLDPVPVAGSHRPPKRASS